MDTFKSRILKPLLFAVSVIIFAVVKMNRSNKNKKIEKKFKKSVDK